MVLSTWDSSKYGPIDFSAPLENSVIGVLVRSKSVSQSDVLGMRPSDRRNYLINVLVVLSASNVPTYQRMTDE